MKVLFCDVDGVININGTFSKSAVKNLNEILAKAPDVKVVVSSSWRRKGLNTVKGLLKNEGVNVDGFIDITDLKDKDDRGHHIERYLMDHKRIEKFAILDDHADMDKVLDHLVKINPFVGITSADVKKALDLLS